MEKSWCLPAIAFRLMCQFYICVCLWFVFSIRYPISIKQLPMNSKHVQGRDMPLPWIRESNRRREMKKATKRELPLYL